MLERLNKEEQRALMQLMACLARADGRVRDIEREVLAQYAELFRLNLAELACECDQDGLESIVAQFQRPEVCVIVLQEIIRVAHIDGIFRVDEESLIIEVAALMGVPLMFLKKIEFWVLEGLAWTLRGEKLLSEAAGLIKPHV